MAPDGDASATGDERVPELMSGYFRYQQETLPEKPLNHWSWWSKMRGGENQASVYWLYNRSGESGLLDLARTLFEQTFDWTGRFESQEGHWHGVNTAMGLKQPALQYLLTGEKRYLEAVEAGFQYLRRAHRQPQGMFSGDELLHGTDPVHGTELCSVVELMYSLEALAGITGRVDLADRLERVAYNALPAQHTADYMGRQYYQQPNQIEVTDVPQGASPFVTDHDGKNNCFGLLNGYPCCTTNMHQGWPKFVRSMWRAAPDGGLAAVCYGPCDVTAQVTGGTEVTIEEDTDYPFADEVRLTVRLDGPTRFPLHLRIPTWADGPSLTVNGRAQDRPERGTIATIDRAWADGDTVTLRLPAAVEAPRGHERSVTLRRGPLVFARPVEGTREQIDEHHGVPTYAVHPTEEWNYGVEVDPEAPDENVSVQRSGGEAYPWEAAAAPMTLEVPGRRVPVWKTYRDRTGPLPPSPVRPDTEKETLTLVPYGATTLRVSALPVVRS
ncbi:MAG: beta-L-arabinofuranosidase domain-containing protein [Salinibacter sp.]